MPSLYRYRCKTCNTDLGAAGTDVEAHLASNPTHSVEELLFYDTKTVANTEGTTRIVNNELYTYDQSRGLWLSTNRFVVGYAIPAATQNNVYMRLWGAMTPTANTMGFVVPVDGVITQLVATRSAGTGTGIFYVRVYGAAAMTSITLTAGVLSGSNLAVNVAVSAGTNLSSYLSGSTTSSYPQLVIEIASRL